MACSSKTVGLRSSCLPFRVYTVTMARPWLTTTAGRPVCIATRSAVRCRVPASTVGMAGSGMRCTLARRIISPLSSMMTAPSILASSASRAGLNVAPSRWNPPLQMASMSEP